MSRCLIILVVFLVAAAAYVLAKPPMEVMLSDIANYTMCPIEVEIDDNPARTPRYIKYIKCAGGSNKLCREHHITHGCCQKYHHDFVTECMEIYDWTEAMFMGLVDPQPIKVPVGCSCLIEDSNAASEVPPALV